MTRTMAVEKLLSCYVVTEKGCWQKPRALARYATIRVDGQNEYAHILIYEHFFGPVPLKHELHHQCENKACFNPYHVHPKTRKDHMKHHPQPKKQFCKHGHELTPENRYWRKDRPGKSGDCYQCIKDRAKRSKERNR